MGGALGKGKIEAPEIPDDVANMSEVLQKAQEAKDVVEFKQAFELNAKKSVTTHKQVDAKGHKTNALTDCEKEKKPVSKVKEAIAGNLPQDKLKEHVSEKLNEQESYTKLPEKLREKALEKAVSKATDVLVDRAVERLLLEWTNQVLSLSSEKKETDAPNQDQKDAPASETKKVVQTGGHADGFLHVEDGKIAKKAGNNEFVFYTEILSKYPGVQPFAPTFFGPKEQAEKKYVVIQDLTHGYKKPCILDIKMGTCSVGEDASPEKKASMAAKDAATTTTTLGIRLVGARVFQVEKGEFVSYDKSWGKAVKDHNFTEHLAKFFHNGKEIVKHPIDPFLELLNPLEEWFNKQSELRFYSSSLLFIYDGHPEADQTQVRLKMIDFAHVHPIQDGGKDDGYILGLKNLRQQLLAVKNL